MKKAARALASAAVLVGCVAPPPATKPEAGPVPVATLAPATDLGRPRHCSWPNGAVAAVSLTYDDALASQPKYAVPVLDRYGLKANDFAYKVILVAAMAEG